MGEVAAATNTLCISAINNHCQIITVRMRLKFSLKSLHSIYSTPCSWGPSRHRLKKSVRIKPSAQKKPHSGISVLVRLSYSKRCCSSFRKFNQTSAFCLMTHFHLPSFSRPLCNSSWRFSLILSPSSSGLLSHRHEVC